jgi:hypothetical protein
MRPAHALKGNKTVGFPTRWVFFDVETRTIDENEDGALQALVLGWAVYCELDSGRQLKRQKWLCFRESSVFWGFVKSCIKKQHKLVLCAHNIGFDFTVLRGFDGLKSIGFFPKSLFLSGGIVIGKWVDRTSEEYKNEAKEVKTGTRKRITQCTTVEIRDSANYYRMPLARVGQTLGIEKIDCDVFTAGEEELSVYCKRDVEILQAAVFCFLQFVGENDLGCLAPTVSSQAFTAFRHRFYHRTIFIHNSEKVCELERLAYCGGRTEAFRIGEIADSPVYVLDVNSLYPSVMRGNLFPRKLEMVLPECRLTRLEAVMERKCLVGRALIDTDVPCYPYRLGGRLVFPVGQFEATLCTPEIAVALERGHLKGLRDVAVYDADQMFTDYVNHMYALRQHLQDIGNKPYGQIAKDLLNHLYGKWGQQAEEWEQVGVCDPNEIRIDKSWNIDEGRMVQTRFMGGKIERMVEKEESYNSFAAIAAHVTSFARVYLWSLMEKAGRTNVLYCDTDSLFLSATGRHRIEDFVHPTSLGMLKEEKVIQKLTIYGAKDYVFDGIIKLKGIRANARLMPDGGYSQAQFPSLKACLSSENPNEYRIKTIVKRLSREYHKGVVQANGCVSPFRLPLV